MGKEGKDPTKSKEESKKEKEDAKKEKEKAKEEAKKEKARIKEEEKQKKLWRKSGMPAPAPTPAPIPVTPKAPPQANGYSKDLDLEERISLFYFKMFKCFLFQHRMIASLLSR